MSCIGYHFLACLLLLAYLSGVPLCAAPAAPSAAIFADVAIPGTDEALVSAIERTLSGEGYQTRRITLSSLASAPLSPETTCLLVLPNAASLPKSAAPAIEAFLHLGGHMLALRSPAWSQAPALTVDGKWVTQAQAAQMRAAAPLHGIVFDSADPARLADWRRSSNTMERPSVFEYAPAPPGSKAAAALHFGISDLGGWDVRALDCGDAGPFRQDDRLTVFWAKGDAKTRSLAVEWDEKDQSRWIATIRISPEWKRYAIDPSEFRSWTNPKNRAAAGFHPVDARRFSIGLAQSHTDAANGPHDFWIAGIGTQPDVVASSDNVPVPAIDTLSPGYKVFPITGAVRLNVDSQVQAAGASGTLAAPGEMVAAQPRPSGNGIGRNRTYRWQPIVTAVDAATGAWRGCPVVLVVHDNADPAYRGGIWETMGFADPAYYRSAGAQSLIASFARRLRTGLYLFDGGADGFTYTLGDTVMLGGTVQSPASAGQSAAPTLSVTVSSPDGKTVFEKSWTTPVSAGSFSAQSAKWTPANWPAKGYTVTTTLSDGAKVIDRLQHKIYAWTPPAKPSFIKIGADGHFHLGDKVWRACGVNYMPSSGIGLNDTKLFEYWIESPSYDPEIIERDLGHVAEIGFNAIAVFIYYRSVPSRNLYDLLRIARDKGLHVNLSLRPFMPDSYSKEHIAEMVNAFRLPENDTVFAYDIAWEPEFKGHAQRTGMDGEWRDWLVKRYGSADGARKAWKFAQPGDEQTMTNPTDAQMGAESGDFAGMVADYRRFLSYWLAAHYSPAVKLLHDIDPNHSVSFRMSDLASPIVDQKSSLPYEVVGLDKAVDFFGPEGYALPMGTAGVKAAAFTVAYTRAVNPAKPVLYAEFGKQVWDTTLGGPSPAMLEDQGAYYADLFRSLSLSDGDGVFFWWYPGGYRVKENSDFGLVNSDGTDRPATKVVRDHAAGLIGHAPLSAPSVYLDFDRFAHPNGLRGTYLDLADSYWAALSAGENVGLRMKNRE